MSTTVNKRLVIEERGDITIARLIDVKILEESEIEIIGNELFELIDSDSRRKIIVDFSLVKFMSSAMLGKLAVLKRKMNAVQGNLRLCAVRPDIYQVFLISQLHRVFSMHDHLDKALDGF